MRKTKIVATLGPATSNVETIRALIKAGVNVFRFNFSHGSHDQHEANLTMIRRIAQEEGVYVAILQDISGPKIRVGVIEGVMSLKVGDRLSFYREGSHQDLFGVTLNYPQILNDLSIGELIYLADGTIRVEVVAIEDGVVHTKVLVGGDLVSRKGVNFPSSRLSIPAITTKDIDDIKFGVRIGVDLMAISFVRRGEDMKQAREIVARVGGNVPLFAKIEKGEALENLDEILDASDGIMVARGDLGVELGVHRVPAAQKRVIAKANERGLPVITATQMLTSMIHSPYPTRAEVSDIANAVLDGSDAVMLSDETTIGSYPELAVKVLDETIRDIERIYPYHRYLNETHPPHLAVAASAVQMAQDIDADGLIVFTKSGRSAREIAKFRPKGEILATSDDASILRRLSVVWGVKPTFTLAEYKNSDRMVSDFLARAKRDLLINTEGHYIITVGYPAGRVGTTNLIRLIDPSSWSEGGIGNFDYFTH